MSYCCETCWVPVTNNGNGMQHFNSKAHQTAVDFQSNKERKMKFSCEICSLEISSIIMLKAHLAGSKHKNCELLREKFKDGLCMALSKENITGNNFSMKKSFTTLDISSSENTDPKEKDRKPVKASSVPRALSSFDIKEVELESHNKEDVTLKTKAYGKQIKINGIYEILTNAGVEVYQFSSGNSQLSNDLSEKNRIELKSLDDELRNCLDNMRLNK